MRIQVLGPVRMWRDTEQVIVGPAGRRAILGLLALQVGSVVSGSEIIEALWGGYVPPSSARNIIHSHISRLRRLLEPERAPRRPSLLLPTAGDGYVLRVPPGSVDVVRFRGLVTAATGYRRRDDLDGAAGCLGQALDLWEGHPLADVTHLAGHPSVTSLVGERWAAVALYGEVMTAAGRASEAVPVLEQVAAALPLDEAAQSRLIRAYHAAGRREPAFATYEATRLRLADELGVDPGTDLIAAHRFLLDDQAPVPRAARPATLRGPDLPPAGERVPEHPPPRAPGDVPFQLPPDTSHFTGRVAELDRLLSLYPDAPAALVVGAVGGMAGVGKTALVVRAAHKMAGRFGDGVLFLDLRGHTPGTDPATAPAALDTLLRGLGVPGYQIPPDLDGRTALYRTMLFGRRVMIVLDNATNEAQIRPLLPGSPGCLVLVTSRRRLAGLDDAVHIGLDLLPGADSTALFHAVAGGQLTDTDSVGGIVDMCGRLPLAIRIAAARLRTTSTMTPAHLHHELGASTRLEALTDGERSVAAALEVSYRHLTAAQQHAFGLLGLHPGTGVEAHALAALAGTTAGPAQRLLADLHAVNLLTMPTHHRYTLHDLVAAYAAHLADQVAEPERRAARDRLLDHYARTASAAMDVVYPYESDHRPAPPSGAPVPQFADRAQAREWLDSELDTLLVIAGHAPGHGRPDHTSHQSATLHRHLRERGRPTDAQALHELALTIARDSGDRAGERNALHGLGHVHRVQGRYLQAVDHFEQVLRIAAETGDRSGEQNAMIDLGWIHWLQDRPEPAVAHLERALSIARDRGDRAGEQEALCNLGHTRRTQGRYRQAVDHFVRALAITRETGDRTGEQNALTGLGYVRLAHGRHHQAADHFGQTLSISRETRNRVLEQNALAGLGWVHLTHRRYALAGDHFRQALAIATDTGNRNWQYESHEGLGRVAHATGRHHEARRLLGAALRLARDLDHPLDVARAHDGLAHTYSVLGDTGRAGHHWRAALAILMARSQQRTWEAGVDIVTIQGNLRDLKRRKVIA